MVATLGLLVFINFYCMHLMRSHYFLSIRSLLCFFFDNIHGLSFHFYLYNEKDENIFYFEKFENFFFFLFILILLS